MDTMPIEIFHYITQPCDLVLTIVAFGMCNWHLYENLLGLMARFPELDKAVKYNPRIIKRNDAAAAQHIRNGIVIDFTLGKISIEYMRTFTNYYGSILCVDGGNASLSICDYIERVLMLKHLPTAIDTINKYLYQAQYIHFEDSYAPKRIIDKIYKFVNVKFTYERMLRLTFTATFMGHDRQLIDNIWYRNYAHRAEERWRMDYYINHMIDLAKGLFRSAFGDINFEQVLTAWIDKVNTTYPYARIYFISEGFKK
ncbi:hypothetical protein F-LCD7_0203 [Faustovirus]|nr:hypothetical protein F-LCD7_0203 [Faustovirus]